MNSILIHSYDLEGLRAIGIVVHIIQQHVIFSVEQERLDSISSDSVCIYHWIVRPEMLFEAVRTRIEDTFPTDQVDSRTNTYDSDDKFIISVSFPTRRLFEHLLSDSFSKFIEFTSVSFVQRVIDQWER